MSCDLYKGTAPDQRTLRAGVRSKRGAKAPHLTYLTFSQFAYWSRSRSHNRRIVPQGSSLQIDWRCRRPGDQGEMPLPSCAVNQLYFHPSIITSTCIKVQSTIKLSLASSLARIRHHQIHHIRRTGFWDYAAHRLHHTATDESHNQVSMSLPAMRGKLQRPCPI